MFFLTKGRFRYTAAALSAILCTSVCQAGDDLQYWVDFQAEVHLHEKVKLKAEQELWYDDDRLFLEETIFLLEWDALSWMSIAIGDRLVDHLHEGEHKRHWEYEHRPTADLTLKQEVFGFRFDWRNRLEYRDKESTRRNYLRYRGRIRVRTPWEWTSWRISPYSSWEAYVEDKPGLGKGEMFNRSRSIFGLSMHPAKHTVLSFFYLLQHQRDGSDGWRPIHVPGVELKFEF